MNRLDGKVAVITGANSGIGLATARLFVAEGAYVFITGRRQKELDEALATIGGRARAVQGDMAKMADLDRLFTIVREEVGTIDVLFANAGGGEFQQLGSITEQHYDDIFTTNVRGVLFTVQKALPMMRDGGSIVLTGSTAASKGTPAFSVYSASKAAIRSFARTWMLDLAPRKIRVNVLVPGPTATPGWRGLAPSDEILSDMIRSVNLTSPAGRLGSPEESAEAALFLASDASSYVNGSELFVDGGAAQV